MTANWKAPRQAQPGRESARTDEFYQIDPALK
jgi:hypothetical protein